MANVNGLSMTPVKPDDTEMMMEERSGGEFFVLFKFYSLKVCVNMEFCFSDGMGMAKFMMDDEGGDDEEMRNSKKVFFS